jgi:hypothetical protein
VDEGDLMRDCLRRSIRPCQFRRSTKPPRKARIASELIKMESKSAGAFTTDGMVAYARDTIALMRAPERSSMALFSSETWREVEEKHSHVSASQPAESSKYCQARMRSRSWPAIATWRKSAKARVRYTMKKMKLFQVLIFLLVGRREGIDSECPQGFEPMT